MPNHFIMRIGNGKNFNNSSLQSIWGINSKSSSGKGFISKVKKGDLLWFITSNSKGHIVAVATFTRTRERVLGPLIPLTPTDEQLGWTNTKDKYNTEVHYKNLYNLTKCNLLSESNVRSVAQYYPNGCKVNLPEEYPNIIRYCKVTNSM